LDGDRLRQGLCRDLGFGLADRRENVRRAAEVARLFLDIGAIAVVALISPLRADRQRARLVVGGDDFLEIYCDCPIEVCETRDVAGLYRRARQGLIPDFTGVTSPYEAPETPELILQTARDSVADCVQAVLAVLERRRVISRREA
jgi:adenylylsulfate kinase